MPVIQYGDALIRIGEMSRSSALSCFKELEFMHMVWLKVNADVDTMNRDIATMLAVAAPVVITQGEKIIKEGEIVVALIDGDTHTITLPLTRESFDDLGYRLSNLWLEAAVSANQEFMNDLKKLLSRITQTISASVSGSEQSDAPATTPQETKTTGT